MDEVQFDLKDFLSLWSRPSFRLQMYTLYLHYLIAEWKYSDSIVALCK